MRLRETLPERKLDVAARTRRRVAVVAALLYR